MFRPGPAGHERRHRASSIGRSALAGIAYPAYLANPSSGGMFRPGPAGHERRHRASSIGRSALAGIAYPAYLANPSSGGMFRPGPAGHERRHRASSIGRSALAGIAYPSFPSISQCQGHHTTNRCASYWKIAESVPDPRDVLHVRMATCRPQCGQAQYFLDAVIDAPGLLGIQRLSKQPQRDATVAPIVSSRPDFLPPPFTPIHSDFAIVPRISHSRRASVLSQSTAVLRENRNADAV